MRDLELLAPARTADIGIAAIGCGADAVYIAGPAFGARQAAGNSVSDIGRLCVHAHRFGARIFATLNTIIYDTELEQAYRMMEELQDAGVDAIIIQDMALSPAGLQLSGAVPGLKIPLHASTQIRQDHVPVNAPCLLRYQGRQQGYLLRTCSDERQGSC